MLTRKRENKMKYNKLVALVLLLIMTVSAFNINIFAESKITAFSGAEGGGMYSLGSRASSNIEVYHSKPLCTAPTSYPLSSVTHFMSSSSLSS